jgi:hypothetical protein
MNIGSMMMGGLGSAPMAAGNAMAGNPQAGGGGGGMGSIMQMLGGMMGGGGGGQGGGGQAEQDKKKKSLDALLMLAQILQQANATHSQSALGGSAGFGMGGMR